MEFFVEARYVWPKEQFYDLYFLLQISYFDFGDNILAQVW